MSAPGSMPSYDLKRLAAPAAHVDDYLARFLHDRSLPGNLREAISYSVLAGGKRLRPVLVVRCCEAVGGALDAALPAAGAIELVHTFSLVHDDLPAMDDDDMRRGRPTLHRHAGQAMAILAGDAMMGLAFELLATRIEQAELARQTSAELSTATNDMIAGQVYDTLGEPEPGLDEQARLERIHTHKTGALLRAACRMGGLAGGADAQQLDALTRYAQAIGLMFQIVDDLLDVTCTAEQLGKAARKDAEQGKLTYPGTLGVQASRAKVQELRQQALAALESFGEPAEPLRELCEYMAVREK